MKNHLAQWVLAGVDLGLLTFSFILAFTLGGFAVEPLLPALGWIPVFVLALFFYQGLYQNRYDFWHESRIIAKTLFLSFLLLGVLSQLVTANVTFLMVGFLIALFLLPMAKWFLKRWLYHLKLWRMPAKILGEEPTLAFTIFSNPYLGYEYAPKAASTLFINSKNLPADQLEAILLEQIQRYQHVIFIPAVNAFDLTHARIYELTNARSNLFAIENRLKNPVHTTVKYGVDFAVTLASLPFALPILGGIALLMKWHYPHEPVLFRQQRLGKGGKPFFCYKFRTMYSDSEALLAQYLAAHPEEVAFYEQYHKYQNDPRITPIGKFLRRSSLDELPQLLNVLKNEMSLIGPRPYLLDELSKDSAQFHLIVSVKPGITGLWQTSGRNALTFEERIMLDAWYIRNWNLWLDATIFLKTFKVILFKNRQNKAL